MAIVINGSTGITATESSSVLGNDAVETDDIADGAVTAAKLAAGAGLPDAIDVNASAPADSLAIDSSGKVGIGTSSPTGKLNVVTDNTHNNGATFDSTGTTQAWFRDTDASSNLKNWGIQSSGGDFNILKANDDRASGFVTPFYITTNGVLAFNSGYGSAAPAYGCRAWVNFNGTGTVAIRGSGNVSSITDNGTGDYTVNFTTAMPDANYSVYVGTQRNGVNNAVWGSIKYDSTPASGSVRIATVDVSPTYQDPLTVSVSIFR